jgi:hypothetical protein
MVTRDVAKGKAGLEFKIEEELSFSLLPSLSIVDSLVVNDGGRAVCGVARIVCVCFVRKEICVVQRRRLSSARRLFVSPPSSDDDERITQGDDDASASSFFLHTLGFDSFTTTHCVPFIVVRARTHPLHRQTQQEARSQLSERKPKEEKRRERSQTPTERERATKQ